MKTLLIVYHSQSGSVERLYESVLAGASHPDIDQRNIQIRGLRAADASLEDLLACHGLILGTPENFGYMSGALKDFFDRTFYGAEGRVEGLPYGLFVKAGNDGTGAVNSVQRIVNGYAFKEVCPPVIIAGDITREGLERCRLLGMTLAAGLDAGIF